MGEEPHKIGLETQHKAFVEVHKHMKKAKQKQARNADKDSKAVDFQVGDAVYLKNNARRGKLDQKWLPYYRILQVKTPITFIIKNQLTGTTSKAHAVNLRKANLDDWEIPKDKTVVLLYVR